MKSSGSSRPSGADSNTNTPKVSKSTTLDHTTNSKYSTNTSSETEDHDTLDGSESKDTGLVKLPRENDKKLKKSNNSHLNSKATVSSTEYTGQQTQASQKPLTAPATPGHADKPDKSNPILRGIANRNTASNSSPSLSTLANTSSSSNIAGSNRQPVSNSNMPLNKPSTASQQQQKKRSEESTSSNKASSADHASNNLLAKPVSSSDTNQPTSASNSITSDSNNASTTTTATLNSKPNSIVPPPPTLSQQSSSHTIHTLSSVPSTPATEQYPAHVKKDTSSMTVETETVAAVPSLGVSTAVVPPSNIIGGSNYTGSVKVKKSTDNVHNDSGANNSGNTGNSNTITATSTFIMNGGASGSMNKPPGGSSKKKHQKSKNHGHVTSKAEVFAAKVASAIDEADSSDSDETFVYESNLPDHRRALYRTSVSNSNTNISQNSSSNVVTAGPQSGATTSSAISSVPASSSSNTGNVNTNSNSGINENSYATLTSTNRKALTQKKYQEQLYMLQQQQMPNSSSTPNSTVGTSGQTVNSPGIPPNGYFYSPSLTGTNSQVTSPYNYNSNNILSEHFRLRSNSTSSDASTNTTTSLSVPMPATSSTAATNQNEANREDTSNTTLSKKPLCIRTVSNASNISSRQESPHRTLNSKATSSNGLASFRKPLKNKQSNNHISSRSQSDNTITNKNFYEQGSVSANNIHSSNNATNGNGGTTKHSHKHSYHGGRHVSSKGLMRPAGFNNGTIAPGNTTPWIARYDDPGFGDEEFYGDLDDNTDNEDDYEDGFFEYVTVPNANPGETGPLRKVLVYSNNGISSPSGTQTGQSRKALLRFYGNYNNGMGYADYGSLGTNNSGIPPQTPPHGSHHLGSSNRGFSPHNYHRNLMRDPYDYGYPPQSVRNPHYDWIRKFIWFSLFALMILGLGFMMGFILATTKPLHRVSLTGVFDVLVSDEELVFDVVVEAINPAFLSVEIYNVDLDVFARSPYVKGPDNPDDDDDKESFYADDDSNYAMLLGNIRHFEVPLVFEGSIFSHELQKSIGQLRLVSPGMNSTLPEDDDDDDNGRDGDDAYLRNNDLQSMKVEYRVSYPQLLYARNDIPSYARTGTISHSLESIGNDDGNDEGRLLPPESDKKKKIQKPPLDNGQKRWAIVNTHPFDLILRGVIKYKLLFDKTNRVASINNVTPVDPNHGDDKSGKPPPRKPGNGSEKGDAN